MNGYGFRSGYACLALAVVGGVPIHSEAPSPMILQWVLFVLTMLGGAVTVLFWLSARDIGRRVDARIRAIQSVEKDWEDTAMAEAQRLRAENAALKAELGRIKETAGQ